MAVFAATVTSAAPDQSLACDFPTFFRSATPLPALAGSDHFAGSACGRLRVPVMDSTVIMPLRQMPTMALALNLMGIFR